MKPKILLFVLGFFVWSLLTWPPDIQHIFVGILTSFLVSHITGDLFVKSFRPVRDYKRCLWFLYYLPLFIWECVKANIDVAYRVSHPDLPIRPGIVKVRTKLRSDTALTFLANSITLTPGTMCVDVDKTNGCLYVHWIYVKDKDIEKSTKLIVETFENILGRIFE